MFFSKILQKAREEKFLISLGIFIGLTFLLTWHGFFTGYEKETWEAAESWVNGHYQVKRAGPVAIILYLPFVLLARIIPVLHTERFFSLVPVFYSVAQTLALFSLVKKIGASEKIAAVWTILVALTSGVWVYANAGMEYQAGLFLALLLVLLLRWKTGAGLAWWPSLGMAALIGTKAYMLTLGLPYLLFLGITLYKRGEKRKFWSFKFLLSAGLLPTIIIILNLVLNWYLHGRLSGSYRFGGEFQIWQWWEGFYGIFFSAGKNIFLYAPLLILTLWLWPRFYRREPAPAVFIFVSLGILAVVNLPFSYWTDETWGLRKFIPILPLLLLPVTLIMGEWKEKTRVLKIIFTIITVFALNVNFLGATYTYGRQLHILRAAEIDSLATMRYLPQWSHPVLFGELFTSYLHQTWTGIGQEKIYQEYSWLRWVQPSGYDILLRNSWLNLGVYNQPSIIWFQPRSLNNTLGLGVLGAWLSSVFLLYFLFKKQK